MNECFFSFGIKSTRTVRGSNYTPALVHFTETLHFVKQPFYISEPKFYIYACMERKEMEIQIRICLESCKSPFWLRE